MVAHMCADEDDEEEDEDEAPKAQKVKETVWDWALLNENKALWLRAPGEVDEEDYEKFYKALAKVRRHSLCSVPACPHTITVACNGLLSRPQAGARATQS